MTTSKWDERYREAAFAYGKGPNLFFKKWLDGRSPGSILMPADGEGRNGVYAARCGWKVTSFDQSAEGRSKALQLAAEEGVTIDYVVGDLEHLQFDAGSFDAIGLIFAHFDADKKPRFHRKLDGFLRSGGMVVLEAFSKTHLSYIARDPNVGGPKDLGMLYSADEIVADFPSYDVVHLAEEEVVLQEGSYHNGTGSVLRFVGRKP
jgi:hypothetical protein